MLLRAYTSPLDQAGPQRDMLHEGHVYGIVNSCASHGTKAPRVGLTCPRTHREACLGQCGQRDPGPLTLVLVPRVHTGEGSNVPLEH